MGAGPSDHFGDLGLICLYPENCVRWERYLGFAPVLVDPNLDYSQEIAPISDLVVDDLPLFLGQIRLIASRIAEPAVVLCHRLIVNDGPEIDYAYGRLCRDMRAERRKRLVRNSRRTNPARLRQGNS